ncbi:hypothetical protein [Spirillospora sp. CA-128828]|uniref:hypothetical protein n=1 Tax=Spirillospora sp. CA-128828 TaxID=3240033 RepID=UPI003D8F573B
MTGKAADKVTVPCKACDTPISTTVRGNAVRCPGCKTANWIPRTGTAPAGPMPVEPGRWEPAPIEPDPAEQAEAGCPDCGDPLTWEPAGTLLYCGTCDEPHFPAELIPRPGGRDGTRQVTTQAERDDQALELAEKRAVILDQIREVLDDEQLTPQSRGRLEWFAAELEHAHTMPRVVELAERLAGERIRRRGWFRSDAVNPAYAAALDEGQDDEDDEGQEDDGAPWDDRPRAIAAPVRAVDYTAELALRGYRVDPAAPDGRCVINERWYGGGRQDCQGGAYRTLGPLRLCHGHYTALTTPLS